MDAPGSGRTRTSRQSGTDQVLLLEQLTDVFRLKYRSLLRLASRVVRDRLLAEEVVQEAFLSALQHGPVRYDPARGTLETWLLTVVHHKAVDAVRHSEHERRIRRLEEGEPRRDLSAEQPDQLLLASQDAIRVHEAVAHLPEPQRRVLVLAYWAGMSQSEIAGRDDTPLGTVKTRSAAALARLRAELLPELDQRERRAG